MHDRETGTDLPGAVGDGEGDDIEIDGIEDGPLSIDAITGKAYAMHAQHQLAHTASSLRCPQHDISIQSAGAGPSSLTLPHTSLPCAYVFTRAYDLHRHLRSQHGIEVERGVVDAWVQAQRH
jgi:general transcription factor IIIA